MSTAKAPKVVLGKRPTTFTKTITGPMADGTTGAIDVIYRYRTRTEWGALLDEHQAAKKERGAAAVQTYLNAVAAARSAEPPLPLPTPPGAEAAQAAEVDADARLVLDIACGWDLPDPFTFDSVRQLADEAPGLITEMVRSYGDAVHEGRLGN